LLHRETIALCEAIGRYHTVNKVAKRALLDDRLGLNFIMLDSGRGGSEMIQKAPPAGIPVVAPVSAPPGVLRSSSVESASKKMSSDRSRSAIAVITR
jgi:formate dehydrogenase assembly factor FdhD